jgi:DNA polymerase-1
MTEKRKKVFLLDGTGLIYRAYYAFIARPLTTTKGENVSALFGFLKMLIQIVRDFSPDQLVIAFDLSRDTFRRKIYPDYKIHREETPRDLKEQIPITIELVRKMGISVLEKENYEADDIIGTLAQKFKEKSDVYIVSGDKDLLQLVEEGVFAIRPQKGISETLLLGRKDVKDSIGVFPEQIPDYLAIVGDTSDNIPGVKGIGEKGAQSLLSKYENLEEIYKHIDEIQGAAQKRLLENKENAFLSKRLAILEKELTISETIGPLEREKFLNPEVLEKLEYYQLSSIVSDLKKLSSSESLFAEEKTAASQAFLSGNYSLVRKREELFSLIQKIQRKKIFSLDTETTSVSPIEAELIGISVSFEEEEGFFVPILYDTPRDFDALFALGQFKIILEDESIRKIGQNIKFEIEVFKNFGINLKGVYFDTMIAAYLLNPTRTHNNLESLLSEYVGFQKKPYREVLKNVLKKDKTLLDIPIEEVVEYAAGDSDAALRLTHHLEPLIKSHRLQSVFSEIEMPLLTVLAVMERNGVKIDTKRLEELSLELEKLLGTAQKKIYHLAGRNFNINSPVQLSQLLFEELGLEPVKKTEGGKNSTDEEVLSILANTHPLPAEILNFRTYSKLKGTYVDALPELILGKTGRIHTSFNQTITATGRLSSSDPNLQNIPVRDEVGQKIREAFIAEDGCSLISADYSQIELRILAHFCGDENMKQAFNENLDIHRHTAAQIFKIKENEVTDEMRRRAKSVNFGILYGLSPYGLSRQIGISMTEAKLFIESYFQSFPRVKGFVDRVLQEAKDTGEVRTLSGRYRRFPELMGKEIKDSGHLSASQRMALNTKIQGTAADIIKMAMIKLQDYLDENNLKTRLILQIHDELVLESPDEEAVSMQKALKDTMEGAFLLDVPLTVEVGSGKNWSEAH